MLVGATGGDRGDASPSWLFLVCHHQCLLIVLVLNIIIIVIRSSNWHWARRLLSSFKSIERALNCPGGQAHCHLHAPWLHAGLQHQPWHAVKRLRQVGRSLQHDLLRQLLWIAWTMMINNYLWQCEDNLGGGEQVFPAAENRNLLSARRVLERMRNITFKTEWRYICQFHLNQGPLSRWWQIQ